MHRIPTACMLSACPTLCDPLDCSPPGSSVHSPGKNTGVGCCFLLQRIFPTQGSNPRLLHWPADSLPLRHLAGKGLARLAQAEQPLDRGSVLSRLGAGLQLCRCGSSLGPFQYRLARTRRQPNSSLPRAGTGHPGLGTQHCLELFAQGLVPLRWGCAREPKRTCQGPKTHPPVSALQQISGEAQSGRRFLGTKGGTLWLWSFLPKTGALGP